MTLNYGELTRRREDCLARARKIDSLASAEKRKLTDAEQRDWDAAFSEIEGIDGECKRAKRIEESEMETIMARERMGDPMIRSRRLSDGAEVSEVRAGARPGLLYHDLSTGKLIRSLGPKESVRSMVAPSESPNALQRALGESLARSFEGTAIAESIRAEVRALSGASDTAGGLARPLAVAANILDVVRGESVCLRSGVPTLVMPAAEMRIARWDSDPTAQWLAENSTATLSEPTTGASTLRARTLRVHVPVSEELIADVSGLLSSLQGLMSRALALKLDRAMLHGGDDGDAESPKGLRTISGVNEIAAVGIPTHDDASNAVQAILEDNVPADEPLTIVMSPREWGQYDRRKDGDGLPLVGPPSWQQLQKLTTTSISITEGAGAESYMILGAFGTAILGMRLDASIQVIPVNQKWQREVVAVLRADFVVPRPQWFCRLLGVTTV